MIRSLYRIIAKAAKTASHVVIGQLLMEPSFGSSWLGDVLSVLTSISLEENCFSNPPLMLPVMSEALFILNKLYDGMLKMKIYFKSDTEIAKNCKELIACGEKLATVLIEKCVTLSSMPSGECFKDSVTWVLSSKLRTKW